MEVYLALLLNPTYSNLITEMLWKTFVGRWSMSLLFSDLEDVIVNKVSYMFYVIKQWKFLNQMIESIVFRIPVEVEMDNPLVRVHYLVFKTLPYFRPGYSLLLCIWKGQWRLVMSKDILLTSMHKFKSFILYVVLILLLNGGQWQQEGLNLGE